MIGFDAQSRLIQDGGGGVTGTWSHTCTGSDRLLVVGVAIQGGNTSSGVTYNGVSMTQINTQSIGGAVFDNLYLFQLKAPATGTNDIVVTASADTAIYCTGTSYTGVDQTTPVGANNTNTATTTNLSVAITTTADNAWLSGFWAIGAGAGQDDFTGGTNTTRRDGDTEPGIWFASGDTNAPQTPTGSKSITLNHPVSRLKGVNATEIIPVAVAPTFTPKVMMF